MSNPVYDGIFQLLQTRSPVAPMVAANELEAFRADPSSSKLVALVTVIGQYDSDIGYDLMERYRELTTVSANPSQGLFAAAPWDDRTLLAIPCTYNGMLLNVWNRRMANLGISPGQSQDMMRELLEIYIAMRRNDYKNATPPQSQDKISYAVVDAFLDKFADPEMTDAQRSGFAQTLRAKFTAMMIFVERDLATMKGLSKEFDSFAAMDFPGYWKFKEYADKPLVPGYLDALITLGLAIQTPEGPRKTLIIGPSEMEIGAALMRGEKVTVLDHSVPWIQRLTGMYADVSGVDFYAGHFPSQMPPELKGPFDLVISFSAATGKAVYDLVSLLAQGGLLLFQQQTDRQIHLPEVSTSYLTLVNQWGSPEFASGTSALYPLGMTSIVVRRTAEADLDAALGVEKLLGGGASLPAGFDIIAGNGTAAKLLDVVTGRAERPVDLKGLPGLEAFGASFDNVERFSRGRVDKI